jgi:hypothetical protein
MRFFKQSLEIRERLSGQAPENAQYASDLSVSYVKIGWILEELKDAKAQTFWNLAKATLVSMVERGWHVSEEDRKMLDFLELKSVDQVSDG